MYICTESWGGILAHQQELLQERPQTEVENWSHGAEEGLLFCWWIWRNSTVDHCSGALPLTRFTHSRLSPSQGHERRGCFFRQTEVCGRPETTTKALHPCNLSDRRDATSETGIEPEEVKAAARWKKSFLMAAIVESKTLILSPSNHQPNKVWKVPF